MGGTEDTVQVTALAEVPESFGMKAVGFKFNPSGLDEVNRVKLIFSQAIDVMNGLRSNATDPEVKRLCSVAITEAQTAQMWAVKALTWN